MSNFIDNLFAIVGGFGFALLLALTVAFVCFVRW